MSAMPPQKGQHNKSLHLTLTASTCFLFIKSYPISSTFLNYRIVRASEFRRSRSRNEYVRTRRKRRTASIHPRTFLLCCCGNIRQPNTVFRNSGTAPCLARGENQIMHNDSLSLACDLSVIRLCAVC